MIIKDDRIKAIEKLLEASGFDLRSVLDELPIDEVRAKLEMANDVLKLIDCLPEAQELQTLLAQMSEDACNIDDHSASQEFDSLGVALQLNEAYIKEHSLDVDRLPEASLVKEISNPSRGQMPKKAHHAPMVYEHVAPENSDARAEIQGEHSSVSELSGFSVHEGESMRKFLAKQAPASAPSPVDPSSLSRTVSPRAELNAGLSPDTQRYIRGVYHRNSDRMIVGTWAYLVAVTLWFLSILPLVFVVIVRDHYLIALMSPVLMLAAMILRITLVRHGSCPVCRQAQYVTKNCAKHHRAHKYPIIGYRVATALHLVRFSWFRCMFCGTSIRVKE